MLRQVIYRTLLVVGAVIPNIFDHNHDIEFFRIPESKALTIEQFDKPGSEDVEHLKENGESIHGRMELEESHLVGKNCHADLVCSNL